jgi:hypothetical protein
MQQLAAQVGGYLRAAIRPSSLGLGLSPVAAALCCAGFRPPCSSGSEVVPQHLCPGLADVELSADRAHRGTGSAASCPGNNSAARSYSGSASRSVLGAPSAGTWELRMTIMSSS